MTTQNDERMPASSPCYADEMRTEQYGSSELLSLLNELLESERAGARGLNELSKRPYPPEMVSLLQSLAQDEGRFCVMLRGHIKRLGGTPSDATGVFFEKLVTREGLTAQMDLLDRGQSAVVRMLSDMLPRLRDDVLLADMQDMHDVHVDNIANANRRAAPFIEDCQ